MDNKHLLLDAANVLINDPRAPELYRQLTDVMDLPDKFQVKLAGEAAALNPLLLLGRADCDKLHRVLDMVELRREARGMGALRQPPADKKFDKNEYQRKLMAERRVRMVKAAEIENLRRPPSGQLIGHSRMEFQRVQQKKWMDRLSHRITAQLGLGPILKEDRAKVADQFWAEVDQELAEAEAATMRWIQSGRKGPPPTSEKRNPSGSNALMG